MKVVRLLIRSKTMVSILYSCTRLKIIIDKVDQNQKLNTLKCVSYQGGWKPPPCRRQMERAMTRCSLAWRVHAANTVIRSLALSMALYYHSASPSASAADPRGRFGLPPSTRTMSRGTSRRRYRRHYHHHRGRCCQHRCFSEFGDEKARRPQARTGRNRRRRGYVGGKDTGRAV